MKCGLFWFILFEVAIAARMRASKKLLSYQSKSKAELSAETCLWSVQSIADYFVMKNYFIEFLAEELCENKTLKFSGVYKRSNSSELTSVELWNLLRYRLYL